MLRDRAAQASQLAVSPPPPCPLHACAYIESEDDLFHDKSSEMRFAYIASSCSGTT